MLLSLFKIKGKWTRAELRCMGCVISGSCRDKAFPSRNIYQKISCYCTFKIKGKWTSAEFRSMGSVVSGSCRDKAFPRSRHIYQKSHATVSLKVNGK
jgi:hypothetical protein